MKLLIEIKEKYGNTLFYPACEASQVFAKLLNQSTLTENNLKLIKQLGYTIEFKQKTINI